MVELFYLARVSMDLTQANHTIRKPPANVISLRNQTMLSWNKNIQPHVIKLMEAFRPSEFFLEVMILFNIDAISIYYLLCAATHNFSGSYYNKHFNEVGIKRSWVPLYLLLTIKL